MKLKYLPNIIFALTSFASFFFIVKLSLDTTPNIQLILVWAALLVIFSILAYPGSIESISFFGNNIRLREVTEEVDKLKLVTEINAKALLEIIQTQMRFGGISDEDREKYYTQLTDTLEKIGFTSSEIKEVQSRWHYWIEGDYVRAMVGSNINHPSLIEKNKQKEWHTKRKEILENVNIITPNKLREIFKEFCNEEGYNKVKVFIDDLEYYKIHKRHQNFDRWKKRNKWFPYY